MKVKDWSTVKYFTPSEFDSPDQRGSGRNMKESFIRKLDEARRLAGIEASKLGTRVIFKINSGYRTKKHNKRVGGVSNSTHLSGYAADIRVRNNTERRIILNSLIEAGLGRRIGIASTFIHVDDHPNRSPSYWTYGGSNSGFLRSLLSKKSEEDV